MSSPLIIDTRTNSHISRWLGLVALFGCLLFIGLVATLHGLRPEFNPATRFMSEYAVGTYGWLMTAAFWGLGIGSLVLVVAIFSTTAGRSRSYPGLVLLSIWSIAITLCAWYPGDLQGAAETGTGKVHNQLSLIAFVSICVGTILISTRFRKSPHWKRIFPVALLLAVLATLAFLALPAFFFPAQLIGLGQRCYLGLVLAWLMTTAWRSRKIYAFSVLT